MSEGTSGAVTDAAPLRARVYRALSGGLSGEGRLSGTNVALIVLIIASILFAVIDSEPTISGSFAEPFRLIETGFGIIFLVEYVLRLWASAENPRYGGGLRGMLRFALTPAALIDLLALSPLVFGAIGSEAYVLRVLRLLRILRLTKIGRYSGAAAAIWKAVRSRRYELGVSLGAGLFLMLISSACLYAIEGSDQPEKFGSILRAMWWSISTLTVGYGDVYPITVAGKVFASITALIGIGLVAVPTGIIAAAFGEVLERPGADRPGKDVPVPSAIAAPERETFIAAIEHSITRAQEQGRAHIEINAGELHRTVGGYPAASHRMPLCCAALRSLMDSRDTVVFQPPGSNGASFTVRYALPR
jgi:voltage-gated potassium channel